MIANLIALIAGSNAKKFIVVVSVMLTIIGGLQIRSCMKAKEKLKAYEQAEKIRQQDKKTDQKIKEYQDEVDHYDSSDDLEHGFDRLRDYHGE